MGSCVICFSLLGRGSGRAAPSASPTGSGDGPWAHWGDGGLDALPLFEALTRAFSRDPERLAEVRRVIDKLRSADGVLTAGEETIPGDFLSLWAVFDQALGGQGGT